MDFKFIYHKLFSRQILLSMKLSFLLLFLSLLQLSANVYSQNMFISLNTDKNYTVKELFQTIEDKTTYRFFYNDDLADLNKTVSVAEQSIQVKDLLNLIFSGTTVSYKMLENDMIIVALKNVLHQGITITGIVTDGPGESIPGVNVMIKGTSMGVVTDTNGKYSINVPDTDAVLIFSFVGYVTREIAVGNRTTIELTLEEDTRLIEEVVVVGYGSVKKSDYTGAISVIKEKDLKRTPATNIGTMLQGLGTGVQIAKSGGGNHPGNTPSIRIRGTRSLSGGNDPLIVVDGIPFDGGINEVNPDDVASIQILKDASATAIYGSRGSNGVILINTLRGADGEARISYNGYVGFNKTLGKYDVYRKHDDGFIDLKKWAQINANPDGTFTGWNDPELYKRAMTFTPEIEGYEAGVGTDWQDLIYSNGILTNHQVNVSGGTQKTQYAFSFGYYDSEGAYKMQNVNRYSVKMSIDQQLGKYMKIGINSLNSYYVRNGFDINPIEKALRVSPYTSPYDDDGELRFVVNEGPALYNPLVDFDKNSLVDTRKKLSTFTTGYLDIDFTKGFKYKLNAGITLSHDTQGRYYAKRTTKQTGGQNWSNNRNYDELNLTIENILTYDKTINSLHNINFTGLYSWQESKKENTSLETEDLLGDMYQYYNPAFGTYVTSNGSYERWDLLSWMGRLNYNFNQKYYLTATLRSDGSSRLAKGNKWNTYGSGSLAWNIINENFMTDQKILSALKLRLSYGRIGSTAVAPYGTLGSLSRQTYNYGEDGVLGYYSRKAPNHALGWENTTTWNIGIDYGFIKNRLSGSIELYTRKTTDLLMGEKYPITSGVADAINTNVGETKGKGIELNLNAVPFEGDGDRKLRWTASLNVFADRSTISRLQDGVTMNTDNGWFVGEPIGVFYNHKRIGIWQDTPEDRDLIKKLYNITNENEVRTRIGTVRVADINGEAYLDGKPDEQINDYDKIILGRRTPDLEGGMNNTLYYRNFDFSLMIYFKVGGLMQSDLHSGWVNTLQGTTSNIIVDYWTPENHANYWPKPDANKQYPDYRTTLSIIDASYLKIRNISLGYTIPKTNLSKIGLSSVRLYSTVTNPFTFFSKYINEFGGLDPETDGTIGINTPAMWSMIFGLNVTF